MARYPLTGVVMTHWMEVHYRYGGSVPFPVFSYFPKRQGHHFFRTRGREGDIYSCIYPTAALFGSVRTISLPSDMLTSPTGLLALLYGRTSTTDTTSFVSENSPCEKDGKKVESGEGGKYKRNQYPPPASSPSGLCTPSPSKMSPLRRIRRRPPYPVNGALHIGRKREEDADTKDSSSSSSSSSFFSLSPSRSSDGDGGGDSHPHRDPPPPSKGTDGVGHTHHRKARHSKHSSFFQRFCQSEALWLGGIILFLSAIWESVLSRQDVLVEKFWQLFSITLEVRSSQQPEYSMIVDWMARQGEHSRNVTLRPVLHRHAGLASRTGREEAEQEEDARALLVPGYGRHLCRTPDGVWLWVYRLEDPNKSKRDGFPSAVAGGSGGAGGVVVGEHDILRLTFLSRRRDVLQNFLSAVRESWKRHTQQHLSLYSTNYGCSWRLLAHRPLRPLHTLYLPSSVKAIVDEVSVFFKSQDVYRALGIPWRRGYLFEGPPGTGKTSFVLSLASTLNLPLYLLPLHTEDMDDESLIRLVSCLPPRCILLVEDVENSLGDVPFHGDAHSTSSSTSSSFTPMVPKSKISMGAFLNALDGVASSEGRVLVMTTNNVSSIPHSQAMLRPGRIDKVIHFSPLQKEEQEEMHKNYEQTLHEMEVNLASLFSSQQSSKEHSPSSVVGNGIPSKPEGREEVEGVRGSSVLPTTPLVSRPDVRVSGASPISSCSSSSPNISCYSNLSPAEYQLALLDRFLFAAVKKDELGEGNKST